MNRPFRDAPAKEIEADGVAAFNRRDLFLLRDAISELTTFRTTHEALRVVEHLAPLLEQLESATHDRGTRPSCRACDHLLANPDDFYCSTCSPQLWRGIEAALSGIEQLACTLYVGRTAFPERRLLEHLRDTLRDRLSILHWADSLEEAESFERGVFRRVQARELLAQKEPRTHGRFSRSHHAIYISWILAPNSPAPPENHVIEDLARKRRWPAPFPHFQVEHLRSPLICNEADLVLKRFEEREKSYLDRR